MNVTISNNSAGTYGGGIYLQGSSNVILFNILITDNTSDSGGGIYCNANLVLTGVTIKNNSTSGSGGGIYIQSTNPTFENDLIINNSAKTGGGIYCYKSSPAITNLTISGNTVTNTGGGIVCNQSSPSILNSIVSNNKGGYGIYVTSGNPSISYSDFYNNDVGNFYGCSTWVGVIATTNSNGHPCDLYNNISMDPMFVNETGGDFHISDGSPCISSATAEGAPSLDFDGNSRPQGSGYDMGCFEYFENGGIAVEISSFIAKSGDKRVELNWICESEIGNAQYIVERSCDEKKFDIIMQVPCQGNPTEQKQYERIDHNVENGCIYYYRLASCDLQGKKEYYKEIAKAEPQGMATVIIEASDLAVNKLELKNNYPNPLNSQTIIEFILPVSEQVFIRINNLKGETVRILSDEFMNAGVHTILWDGRDRHDAQVASGIYTYSVTTQREHQFRKMILLR